MKRSAPLTLIVLSLLFIPLGRNSYGAEENAGILLGKSRTEITPPVGTPLSGYGKRKGKPSSGVHDSLYARTIILSHQNERFVFTSVDLVLVDEELRMAVLKKIRKSLELEDRQFVLMATHNHSGAGAIGGRFWERFIMGKKNKAVYEGITDAIAKSVLEASNRPTPVLAELGTADISRWVENRMDGKDNRLKHLKVLRFQNDSKQTAAYMLFMAAHPTILPASNFEFSGDYPGRFCSLLEDKNPDSVALFVNGAAGDLRPRLEGYENRFDKMEAYASTLANAVNSISFKPIELTGVWASALERKKLPWTKIGRFPLQVPVIISNRVFPRKSYFQVFRMGRAAFVTFPGELASETGTSIERRLMAKSFEPFLIGFANDYIGYVIPRRHYLHHDHYESRASFYGPKMDRFTEKTLDAIITHLLSPHEREVLNPEGRLLKTSKIPVLKLHGDPYHRGYEEGRLLKSEIQQGVRDIFAYFRSELKIPGLNRLIINAILDRAWKKMAPYVSYDEYEQMRGLADGSGVSFKIVKRIHALPEVYPTFCANSAFWGPATKDGRLIAIRNLDWNKKMGIHRHAAVKIHHMFGQATAVNIGYYGFIGVLSGLNEHGISVGQIGATSSDETMKGVPMPFVLKRILEESSSLDEARAVFERSDLTRGYNYIIADAEAKEAMAVEATHTKLAFFRDADPKEKEAPYSFSVSSAVFRGDPALDPAIRDLQLASKGNPKKPGLEMPAGSAYEIRYKKHGELIQKHFGEITVETAEMIAQEIAPGSNIQSVIYAFPEFKVANREGDIPAAKTKYAVFNFDELSRSDR